MEGLNMNIEEIKEKVNDIIYDSLKDRIKYEDIKSEKHLIDDFGIDSIDALDIFLTIMSDFDVEMDRRSIAQLKSINEIYLYVEKLINNKVSI
jgi:acyl carrier protein